MALKPEPQPRMKSRKRKEPEDAALLGLSRDDRDRLGIDAWEPSLLRELLTAQNRLKQR